MFNDVIFDPPIPREYILALSALVCLLTVLNYWRTRREVGRFKRFFLTTLRLAVVIALTVVLMRPMALEGRDITESRSVFTIAIDTSESMNTTDIDDRPRLEVVQRNLMAMETSMLKPLRQKYDLQFVTFSQGLRATTLEALLGIQKAEGAKTDLAGTLTNVGIASAGRKHIGMLLVSDGRENEGGEITGAATYLKSINLPVWTTTVGTMDETKDLFVSARFNQNFLFRGQEAALKVDLGQTGFDGWYAKVEVLRNDESVSTEQVMLKGGNARLTIPIQEERKGAYRYTVKVEPLRGEADHTNNERSVFIQVVDDRAKVLFIEAEPYWDSKFLLRTLQADPNLEVTAIFDLSPRRNKVFAITQASTNNTGRAQTIRMPRTEEELFEYDCVILGHGINDVFTATELDLFRSYVENRGGSLVFARGKSYRGRESLLAELEPVVWDDGGVARARFELTSAGTVSPIFDFGGARSPNIVIQELPEMISIAKVEREKSLAVILAKGMSPDTSEEIATIAYQRYGRGKVMTVGAAGLWQWAFMHEDLSHYDEVYARFWGQMIRWLVYGSDFLPGQDITFRTDRFSYNLGENIPLVVQTKHVDAAQYKPRIEVIQPGGERTSLEPTQDAQETGIYSALFTPEEEGSYKAILHNNVGAPEEETIEFGVYADAIERRFVASNADLMAQISEITGGGILELDQWAGLPQQLGEFDIATREELKPEDIWDTFKIFAIVMGVLAAEWYIRRSTGLV